MSLPLTATLFYKSAYPGVVQAFSSLPRPQPFDVAFAVRANLALCPPSVPAALALVDQHADSLGPTSSKALQAFARVVEATQEQSDEVDLGTQVSALADLHSEAEEREHFDGELELLEVLLATTQHLDQDPLGALETLKMGTATQKNLGSLALGIHLLLLNHRLDLAQKEYEAARSWADDSLVIQLIEASLGLYAGGRAAQQAYYVYDEFASPSATSEEGKQGRSTAMKLGRAVALMKRGDFAKADETAREAATTLEQTGGAGGKSSIDKDVQANLAVLALHLNPGSKLANPGQEHLDRLSSPPPPHQLATSLSEMSRRFDDLVANRAVSAASATS